MNMIEQTTDDVATGDQAGLSADNPADDDQAIVLRPDGYYWVAAHGEVGPFSSWSEALADQAANDETPETGETLQEAEADIGVADWIDPETGEPAEGLCPPHLDGD